MAPSDLPDDNIRFIPINTFAKIRELERAPVVALW